MSEEKRKKIEPQNPLFYAHNNARFSMNDQQKETLIALCDSFIPGVTPPKGFDKDKFADYFNRSASKMGVPEEALNIFASRVSKEDKEGLLNLFSLLGTSAGNFLFSGRFAPFASLSLEDRIQVLKDWSMSPFEAKRKTFRTFKNLVCVLFFTNIGLDGKNVNWDVLNYPGSDPMSKTAPKEDFVFQIEDHDKLPETLEADAVIIGSGAGGGIVAGELAKAGFKVIVIEKGEYVKQSEFNLIEKDAYETLYENGGAVTSDSGMSIYAGSVFGGGTSINWSASFRTPQSVLEEWSKEHGLPHFTSPDFQKSLDAVCQRIGVHADETVHNSNNQTFTDGCKKLGFHHGVIPRNAPGAHTCGWCGFGCKFGLKQGMVQTFLRDAAESGNCRFITSCFVDRVVHDKGKALGVEAILKNGKKIKIKSKVTIVSAGSIHSPALLIRSKVPNKNIGKNLRLHPVVTISGDIQKETKVQEGCIMSWYSDVVGNLDGKGYGAKLETPASHPGIFSTALSWNSPKDFKTNMLKFSSSVCGIVLIRDKDSGEVKVDQRGQPKISYPLSKFDRNSLVEGLVAFVKLLVAQGAKEIATGIEGFRTLSPKSTNVDDPEVKKYIEDLRKIGIQNFRQSIFSAHQMGTCRMGSHATKSVLNEKGESWEIKNLFVADASTFPTSSGVNPMVTTEAISYSVAQNVKARLSQLSSRL